jgi:hypothetical protein
MGTLGKVSFVCAQPGHSFPAINQTYPAAKAAIGFPQGGHPMFRKITENK